MYRTKRIKEYDFPEKDRRPSKSITSATTKKKSNTHDRKMNSTPAIKSKDIKSRRLDNIRNHRRRKVSKSKKRKSRYTIDERFK